ncbi:MAG: prepilin-type N-terminal cleavage/methylation domain-containing protein [Candidatus Curtissbacteria bacterium]
MPFLKSSIVLGPQSEGRGPHGTVYSRSTIVHKGFTLIELLIVITIIAILVGAGSVSWSNAQVKGRDSKRKTDLKAVQQALELYSQANGTYPSSSSGKIQCNVTGDTSVIDWTTGVFSCEPTGKDATLYMQRLPGDPTVQPSNGYYYSASSPYTTYVLSANLENNADPEKTNLPCTPQSGRNYCAINP